MSKTIHLGDIHLKIPEKHEEWYINRYLKFIEHIKEQDASEIIITGDIFTKAPTALEAALFLGWIQQFDCPVYLVEGNHDRTNRKSIRANYLEHLINLIEFPNVVFSGAKPVTHNGYFLVSNRLIREGYEIPVDKNLTLLSHIRHELNIAGSTKKAEYDLKKLTGFKACLLSDIHTTFQYAQNIYYSGSPWRTHKKTITDTKDIDNSFFGYNVIENEIISHIELYLPNHYVLNTTKKVVDLNSDDLIEVHYEIGIDDIQDFDGEHVKIKHTDTDIEIKEDLYELVYSILEEEYSIKEPKQYMDLLVDVVGEI